MTQHLAITAKIQITSADVLKSEFEPNDRDRLRFESDPIRTLRNTVDSNCEREFEFLITFPKFKFYIKLNSTYVKTLSIFCIL